MRYAGQGWEIPVHLDNSAFDQLMAVLNSASDASDDVLTLSDTGKKGNVMGFLDDVLDLSGGGSLVSSLSDLSAKDAEGALQSLARLLEAGVVGYEYRKVNGQVQKVFIDVAMGSDLHRAPLAKQYEIDQYA